MKSDTNKAKQGSRRRWIWWGLGTFFVVVTCEFLFETWTHTRYLDDLNRNVREAHQIVVALRAHAAKEGSYMTSLDGLIGGDIPESFIYGHLPDGSKQERWIYFGRVVKPQSTGLPILAQAMPLRISRVIATDDANVEVMKEQMWQAWLDGDPDMKPRLTPAIKKLATP